MIVGRRFGNAEIFHGFRYLDPHLLAHPEIMVNGIARSKDHRCIVEEIDAVFPKIFGRDAFDFKKFPECYVNIEFPCNFAIG